MLNWDDPLAELGRKADPIPDEIKVRPGQGLQDNRDRMQTAGAAPCVDPDPVRGTSVVGRQGSESEDQISDSCSLIPDSGAGGTIGLEALEIGAARIRVDDKKIINCRADLNQLVPFKYQWAFPI